MKPNYKLLSILLVFWALACSALQSPTDSKAGAVDASGTQPAMTKCAPQKTILPDGSIFVRLADCTTKQISKSEFANTEGSKISPEGNPPSSPTGIGGSGEGLMPMAPAPEVLDPAMKEKYREALNGYYAYRIVGYVHRERVFKWQLFSSKIIFAVVLLLVCSGIYFAALQFHAGLRRMAAEQMSSEKARAAGASVEHVSTLPVASEPEVTTFAASLHGVKVSSPVLGVIILTISLAFFYLYLVYVYPITDVF